MERRTFLKGGLALAAIPGIFALGNAKTKPHSKEPVLVVVFQRGGMDGLMAVPPLDNRLEKLRPQLAMNTGKGERGGLMRLNGQFGLHPAFNDWDTVFRSGEMAVIHGAGLTRKVRSHFDAQAHMEAGDPRRKGPHGWVGRAAQQISGDLLAVAMEKTMPLALAGTNGALALQDLDSFASSARQVANMGQLYGSEQNFGGEAYKKIAAINWRSIRSGSGYPRSETGKAMRDLARLLKADLGIRLAFVASDGWDTHRGQGTVRGAFSRAANNLATSINAFRKDLSHMGDRLLVLTMTEFGRTVAQNGSGGTDHGRGSCFFAFGTGVRGGKVYGQIPTLRKADLEDGRDLPVTTDFRNVLHEVIGDHLGLNATAVLGAQNGKLLNFTGSTPQSPM